MKGKNIYFNIFLSIFFFLAGCGESLEDTYKDYAGDGVVRYIGMTSNLRLTSGWERLILKWDNSIDPVVDKVKVTWSLDGVKDSILLDKEITEYNITNLKDGTYEIVISSVDKEGRSSLPNITYGRPYSENHEVIQSFSRVVAKHYIVNNRLVLLFSGWQRNILSASLSYTQKDGSVTKLELDENFVTENQFYLSSHELDPDKPIYINRTGELEDCSDIITFKPLELIKDRVYTSDFKMFARSMYGFVDAIPDDWAENIEELEFDVSMSSFEDILNFPRLKKLILGKNRYLHLDVINDPKVQCSLSDVEISNFSLSIANELLGLEVERYNKHFDQLDKASFIKEMGNTNTIPNLNFLDIKEKYIELDPADEGTYNSHVEYLIDGKLNTSWQPFNTRSLTTYSLTIDLDEVRSLSGFKLVQKTFEEGALSRVIAPSIIKVLVSENQSVWHNVTYFDEIVIGNSSGETCIVPFVEKKSARYVRIIVDNTPYIDGTFQLTFAEIGLY